jgi:hypothetical protein
VCSTKSGSECLILPSALTEGPTHLPLDPTAAGTSRMIFRIVSLIIGFEKVVEIAHQRVFWRIRSGLLSTNSGPDDRCEYDPQDSRTFIAWKQVQGIRQWFSFLRDSDSDRVPANQNRKSPFTKADAAKSQCIRMHRALASCTCIPIHSLARLGTAPLNCKYRCSSKESTKLRKRR